MRHARLEADVRCERLLARARGNALHLGEDRGWMTNSQLQLHSFDTVVSVLQLCRIDDTYSALLRVGELLAPNGQLLAFEHVRSTGWRGSVQDRLSALNRCRPNRDVVGLLRQNGFAVTDCERFVLEGATPLVRHAVSVVAIRKVRNEVAST
jgi:hypothetical protein